MIARTRSGTAVRAWRVGPADAEVRLVVIGQIHGNEPAGVRVVDALMAPGSPLDEVVSTGAPVEAAARTRVAVWLIRSLNPDGARRGRRVNARGVDLNRNFPAAWARQGEGTTQWSGPTASSEPEVIGVMASLAKIRPHAVLVMHQDYAVVDTSHPRSRRAGRVLAAWLGLPARPVGCAGPCHGTLTQWADQALGAIALTIELPAVVRRADVLRDAAAIARLSSWLGTGQGR
ncbi:MAG: DUF2817 domain-containing protein [Actinomycetales bacterium]|nr:DUF2817 domain-containing protein [Actinomycetales bacterium]